MSLSSSVTVSMTDLLPQLPGYRAKDPAGSPKRPVHFDIVNGSMMMREREDGVYGMGMSGSGQLSPTSRALLNRLPALSQSASSQSILIDDSTCTSSIGAQGRLNRSFGKSPSRTQFNMSNDAPIILTFDAFFEEVPAFGPEAGRLCTRFVKIYYYVNESKLKVVEVKPVTNSYAKTAASAKKSGSTNGSVLVRKNYVLRPAGPDGQQTPYLEEDMRLGEVLTIYGRDYVLTDCDAFTKKYLGYETTDDAEENYFGVEDESANMSSSIASSTVLAPQDWGKFRSKRNGNKLYMEAMMGNTVNNTGREGYNKYGNTTLHFQCVWDNTHTLYGDRLKYTLEYYLSDDSIEIFTIPTSEIKEQFSRLLKRGKLPKNLSENNNSAVHTINDAPQDEYYHWSELRIGTNIEIYGRQLRIVNCDAKTREFYKKNGIDQGTGEPDPVPKVCICFVFSMAFSTQFFVGRES
jgi:hypothetical protein